MLSSICEMIFQTIIRACFTASGILEGVVSWLSDLDTKYQKVGEKKP